MIFDSVDVSLLIQFNISADQIEYLSVTFVIVLCCCRLEKWQNGNENSMEFYEKSKMKITFFPWMEKEYSVFPFILVWFDRNCKGKSNKLTNELVHLWRKDAAIFLFLYFIYRLYNIIENFIIFYFQRLMFHVLYGYILGYVGRYMNLLFCYVFCRLSCYFYFFFWIKWGQMLNILPVNCCCYGFILLLLIIILEYVELKWICLFYIKKKIECETDETEDVNVLEYDFTNLTVLLTLYRFD